MSSPECVNPLLLGWIKEWLDAAQERNSKGAGIYKKAYSSIKACPLVFAHPSEAQVLHGLGPKLCDRLTEKLAAHCAEHGLPMPERPQNARKRQNEDTASSAAPSKKPRKSKPYVPNLRSGAYAIVLSLSTLPESSDQGLTKTQTIELAQPHCDSSFTAPNDPTKFYTAWSSMKTLIEKDLVFERRGASKKYALTEDGWEVAKRMRMTAGGSGTAVSAMKTNNSSLSAIAPSTNSGDPSTSRPRTNNEETVQSSKSSHTLEKNINELNHSRTGTHSGKSYVEGHVGRQKASAKRGFIDFSSSPAPKPSSDHNSPDIAAFDPSERGTRNNQEPTYSRSLAQLPPKQSTEYVPPSFKPILISPDSFTVELVIDNREVRSKTDRDYIQDGLTARGVKPLVRPLELGDALWVAKCKDPNLLARQGEEGDEIVLDWIVERKRLDDLIGSIKDGRFYEQKFRLRKSGLKNVIYIVEEIAMNQETVTKYHDAVQSAIASTQVVNGFFVKRTQKLDDTIRYLARMTTMLKKLYESSPLHLIPTSYLQPTPSAHLSLLTHLRTTQPQNPHHITYPSFSALASKSDTLTLRDVFLKMLLCTRGLTRDKALEVQKRWTTPRAFFEAYEKCASEKERKGLLVGELGGLVGKGKVKRVLSEKVAEVWAAG